MTIRPGISKSPRNKTYVPDQFCSRDFMIFFRLAELSLSWTFLVTSPTYKATVLRIEQWRVKSKLRRREITQKKD
jgi:hypothetical protein